MPEPLHVRMESKALQLLPEVLAAVMREHPLDHDQRLAVSEAMSIAFAQGWREGSVEAAAQLVEQGAPVRVRLHDNRIEVQV